jgi:hypothetical protein
MHLLAFRRLLRLQPFDRVEDPLAKTRKIPVNQFLTEASIQCSDWTSSTST